MKKKTLSLKAFLIIDAIVLCIASFFIFRIESAVTEPQRKKEVLQKITYIKELINDYTNIPFSEMNNYSMLMQAEVDALAYAADQVTDFEITDQVRSGFACDNILINPPKDSSRTIYTAEASDGTIYGIDTTDNESSVSPTSRNRLENPLIDNVSNQDLFFMFDESGNIIYYAGHEDLENKNVSELGIELNDLKIDDVLPLKFNGSTYYTGAARDENLGITYVYGLHPGMYNTNNNITAAIICAAMAILITLVVIHIYFSRQDEKLKSELEEDPGYERNKNLWIFSVIGICLAGLITYHIQSLFCLSIFSISNNNEAMTIETRVEKDIEIVNEAIKTETNLNTQKTKDISVLMSSYPELQTSEHLKKLAKIYSFVFLSLADADMNEIATTALYKSQFEDYENESFIFDYITYIDSRKNLEEMWKKAKLTETQGISNPSRTGANTVTAGFEMEQFNSLSFSLPLHSVLEKISVPDDSKIIVIDPETKQVIYSTNNIYNGENTHDLGLNADALKENSFGEVSIHGERNYYTSTSVNGYLIFLMKETKNLFGGRIDIVATTVLICTICTAFLLLLLKRFEVSPLPIEDEPDNYTRQLMKRFAKLIPAQKKWVERTPVEKTQFIANGILNILSILVLGVALFRSSLYSDKSIFGFIVNSRWQKGVNLFAFTTIAIIYLTYNVIMDFVGYLFEKLISAANQKNETLLRLTHSFIVYVSMIGLILYCLYLLGMDSKAILASAGLLGLVISWGSQDLLTDILAGLFIIFEHQFQVGDIIEVNGQIGWVKEIGVRTTRIVMTSGDILNISNRKLSKIVNKSCLQTKPKLTLYFDYDQNIPAIESLLKEELPKLSKIDPGLINGPNYAGITSFEDSSIRLIVDFVSLEKDVFRISCKLNSELCRMFDDHGFKMGIEPIHLEK